MSEQPASSTTSEKAQPAILSFDMADPKVAANAIKIHRDLITFHTDPAYHHLLEEFFGDLEKLDVEKQLHACQIELSNAVVSYYITQSLRAKFEAEQLQKEVAEEIPGTGHAI